MKKLISVVITTLFMVAGARAASTSTNFGKLTAILNPQTGRADYINNMSSVSLSDLFGVSTKSVTGTEANNGDVLTFTQWATSGTWVAKAPTGGGGGVSGSTSMYIYNGSGYVSVSTTAFPGATITSLGSVSTVTFIPAINSTYTALTSTGISLSANWASTFSTYTALTSTAVSLSNYQTAMNSTATALSISTSSLFSNLNSTAVSDSNFWKSANSTMTALGISTQSIQAFFAGFASTSDAQQIKFENFETTTNVILNTVSLNTGTIIPNFLGSTPTWTGSHTFSSTTTYTAVTTFGAKVYSSNTIIGTYGDVNTPAFSIGVSSCSSCIFRPDQDQMGIGLALSERFRFITTSFFPITDDAVDLGLVGIFRFKNLWLTRQFFQSDVQAAGVPLTSWINLASDNSLPNGPYSMIQMNIGKDQPTIGLSNGLFVNSFAAWQWLAHLNIDPSTHDNWGVVVGVHGSSSAAGITDLDNFTSDGWRVYVNTGGVNAAYAVRFDEDPLAGVVTSISSGLAFAVYKSSSLEMSIGAKGQIKIGGDPSRTNLNYAVDIGTLSLSRFGFMLISSGPWALVQVDGSTINFREQVNISSFTNISGSMTATFTIFKSSIGVFGEVTSTVGFIGASSTFTTVSIGTFTSGSGNINGFLTVIASINAQGLISSTAGFVGGSSTFTRISVTTITLNNLVNIGPLGNGIYISSFPIVFVSSQSMLTVVGNGLLPYVALFTTGVPGGLSAYVTSISSYGGINQNGPAPVLTSCGSSPNPTIYGTDGAFTITVGGTATGCTATFATNHKNKPTCHVTNQSMSITSAMTYTESNTAVVISQATGISGDIIDVTCAFHD